MSANTDQPDTTAQSTSTESSSTLTPSAVLPATSEGQDVAEHFVSAREISERLAPPVESRPAPLALSCILIVIFAIAFAPWYLAKQPVDPTAQFSEHTYDPWTTPRVMLEGNNQLSVLKEAVEAEQHRHFARAVVGFTALIKVSSHRAYNLFHRARCYFGLQNYELALQDLNEAIRLNPDDCDFYFLRADVHKALSQDADAERDYTIARKLLQ